jgi:hypothetical protein
MKRRWMLLGAMALIGCAPGLNEARFAVNRTSEAFAATEPGLEKQRAAAGTACFERFPPGAVELAAEALYAALVAARAILGSAEAGAALGRAPSVPLVLAVVGRALDAAAALDVALEVLQRETKPRGPP